MVKFWERAIRRKVLNSAIDQSKRLISLRYVINTFTSILYEIATKTIPKTSTNPKSPIKPWFNDECKQAVNERKRALYRFEREPTLENKIEYKRPQAKSRKIIKTNKRKSWHEYVNKLQCSTPIKKVWDKVKKR